MAAWALSGFQCDGTGRSSAQTRKPPSKARVVVAAADARRQLLEQTHIAAAQQDVFGGARGPEQLRRIEDHPLPLVLAQREQAALTGVVLEGLIAVGQVRQLERHDAAIVDQRGAEPGAEPEEQHSSPLVTAERLHGRVVDDARRHAHLAFVVEADPAAPEIPGLFLYLAAEHGAWNADRGDVEDPAGSVLARRRRRAAEG